MTYGLFCRLTVAACLSMALCGGTLAQSAPADGGAELRNQAMLLYTGSAADKAKAVELFEEAAAAGDALSMAFLGESYLSGNGVAADRQKAIDWYLKAAQAGHPGAAAKLAEIAAGASPIEDSRTAPEGPSASVQDAEALWLRYDPEKDNRAVEMYQELAAAGDPAAMYRLGEAYHTGRGVESDAGQALHWYQAASDAGNADGLAGVASLYLYGTGVTEDKNRARDLANRALAQGSIVASRLLGKAHLFGFETRDVAEAQRMFQLGIDQGDAESFADMGFSMMWGDPPDPAAKFDYYRKAYDAGYLHAGTYMGVAYRSGDGVEANGTLALLFLQEGADRGDIWAMTELGDMYFAGEGVVADRAAAAKLYRQAADEGWTDAMVKLGTMSRDGTGVPTDLDEARRWYQKAVDAGDTFDAPGLLAALGGGSSSAGEDTSGLPDDAGLLMEAAMALDTETATPAEKERARALYERASDLGDIDGMTILAGMLTLGEGGPVDYPRAFSLYLSAAQAGDMWAMRGAARALEEGIGVPSDVGEALEWYRKAKDAGMSDAAEDIARAEALLAALQPPPSDRWTSFVVNDEASVGIFDKDAWLYFSCHEGAIALTYTPADATYGQSNADKPI